MATKNVTVCDIIVRRSPCGEPATNKVEVKVNGKRYSTGDVCDAHQATLDEFISRLGFDGVTPAATKGPAKKSTKQPKTMKTASGAKFTTKDARAWLVEQGEIPATATGLIAKDKLKMYADAH